jgi:integrase
MARYTIQTPDGPKRKTIYGRAYKEVETALAKARGDAARGITYDAGKQTVEEYLARWLADSVRDTVRLRTYERYESIVRVHLVPAIGSDKLKTLTPAHVRGLYRSKLESGLAPRTVLHIHRTLSKALKQAHDDGLIPRNVAGPVKPPRPRTEEIRPLDREQVRALFEAAKGDRLEALYVAAVTAGLRRGELQGPDGKTWISTREHYRCAARSPSRRAATSSRPPRAARDATSGLRRWPWPPSASTVGAS